MAVASTIDAVFLARLGDDAAPAHPTSSGSAPTLAVTGNNVTFGWHGTF